MWCIPDKPSAEFVFHLEDVLDVYHRPYDPKRPVVCVDETFKQLIGETREPLPMRSGTVERFDYVYTRNGVASLFLACEPLAVWRHIAVTEHRRDPFASGGALQRSREAGADHGSVEHALAGQPL